MSQNKSAMSAARLTRLLLDVTDGQAVRESVAFLAKKLNGLDILVNNAAIDVTEPVREVSPENCAKVLEVNLTGVFKCSRVAADQMIRQGRGGSIINISSIASRVAIERLAAYSSAKAGANQLTRVMALELASHRIRVNAVAPGYLENIMENAIGEQIVLRSRVLPEGASAVLRLRCPEQSGVRFRSGSYGIFECVAGSAHASDLPPADPGWPQDSRAVRPGRNCRGRLSAF